MTIEKSFKFIDSIHKHCSLFYYLVYYEFELMSFIVFELMGKSKFIMLIAILFYLKKYNCTDYNNIFFIITFVAQMCNLFLALT